MKFDVWTLHGDGKHVAADEVVLPEERLTWPLTIGIGLQHVVAMFGATVLVPLLIGFPVSTTILFSGIGTLIFLLLVRNRVPSYLGSSFAFIAPVLSAQAEGGIPAALCGIFAAGFAFFMVGLIIDRKGAAVIDKVMPPILTGAIVALIGLNLAPAAKGSFEADPWIATVTLAAVLVIGIAVRGFMGRLSIFLGVALGYIVAVIADKVDFAPVGDASWVGLPDFTFPTFDMRAILLAIPAVVVLIAENTGHVKAVGAMTERNLDDSLGRAFMGDGAATMLAGLGGGSGTTTYAENIGVMAATRVYSTAAYFVAAFTAILLGLIPKFGALIATIPAGVLGGVTTILYGMIVILGARIWIDAKVDFRDPVNLTTAAFALIVGAADYTVTWRDYTFNGITLGAFGAVLVYHLLRAIRSATHATPEGAN